MDAPQINKRDQVGILSKPETNYRGHSRQEHEKRTIKQIGALEQISKIRKRCHETPNTNIVWSPEKKIERREEDSKEEAHCVSRALVYRVFRDEKIMNSERRSEIGESCEIEERRKSEREIKQQKNPGAIRHTRAGES